MMSKLTTKILTLLIAIVIPFCGGIQTALATDRPPAPLKEGCYSRWFDRMDLSGTITQNGKNYAQGLYEALVEGAKPNSENCWLIDPTCAPRHVDEKSDYHYLSLVTLPGSEAQVKVNYKDQIAQLGLVVMAFIYDYPETFWITLDEVKFNFYEVPSGAGTEVRLVLSENKPSASSTTCYDIRQLPYRSPEKILAAIAEREACIDQIITPVKCAPRYDQIRHINKTLVESNGLTFGDLTKLEKHNSHYALHGLCALKGVKGENAPTCGGYSRAAKMLCDALGIPCTIVNGTNVNYANKHLWNLVQMEDDQWYILDVSANNPLFPEAYNPFCGYINEGYDYEDGCREDIDRHTGDRTEAYLLVGMRTVCDKRMCFLDSHTPLNQLLTTYYKNGPRVSRHRYRPAL